MACWDERPGEQLRLPRLLATAPSERVRERLDPRVSVRFRERGVSGVGRLVRSQDLESAGSRKVVKCAVFALLPLSDFRLRQSQQNIEDVAAPFQLPCSESIGASLTKYVANKALPHPTGQSISAARARFEEQEKNND